MVVSCERESSLVLNVLRFDGKCHMDDNRRLKNKEFDTRRHRKRLQLQSRQLYFRCKQKLLKSQLRGRSWPILYIIVFLGVVWITVLVFCQFKQKIGKKSPFFFHKSAYFLPLNHFCKGFAQQTQTDKVVLNNHF